MKKLIINIITILVVVGVVIFLQHRFFPTVVNVSTHTSDTVWNDTTIIKFKTNTVWEAYYVETIKIDTIKLPVDSAAITEAYLKLYTDYHSVYFHKDTLQNDSSALAILDYEISQNKPKYKSFTNFNRIPSIINNTTNIYSQNELYVGLGTGKDELTANLLFKSKKGYIFEAGYDPFRSNFEVKGFIDIKKLKIW